MADVQKLLDQGKQSRMALIEKRLSPTASDSQTTIPAGETQDLPDTLPATDMEVQNALTGKGEKGSKKEEAKEKKGKKEAKGKHKKTKEAKGKKAHKSKKSKKTKVLKKGKTSKGSKLKGKSSKASVKKGKDGLAKRDLQKEFDRAALTEQVPATQPDKSSDEEGDHEHGPRPNLVGYVYYSAKDQWQLKLQKLMVGEDYKQCIVEAGGYILFFEDENCVLSHLPDRTQFPLRVFREPVQAQAYAQIRASEKEQEDAKRQKQAETLAAQKKVEDEKISQSVAEELADIEKNAAKAAEKLAEQKAAAKKLLEEQERKKREMVEQLVAKEMAERKMAEEKAKAAAQQKMVEEAKIAEEVARKLAEQKAAEDEKKALKELEERQEAEKMAQEQKAEKEKAAIAQEDNKDAARRIEEPKKTEEEDIALKVAQMLETENFSDNQQRYTKIVELVRKAKGMMGEDTEQEKKEEERKAVEELLLRPATMDLTTPPATPLPAPSPMAAPSTSLPDTPLPPGEEEAEKLKAAALERHKKRNAQWGRFMRTFVSTAKKTPDDIKELGQKAIKQKEKTGDSSALHELFEEWITSGEEWRKSQLFIRIQNNNGTIDSDARGWVSVAELEAKLGPAGADSMITFLEATAPEKCRDHPDAPGVKECRQYNVLIKDEMEKRKEDWVTKTMECKDGSSSDSSSEGPKRKSKGKKEKNQKAGKDDAKSSKQWERKIEKAVKNANKKIEAANDMDMTQFPSDSIKKAVEDEVAKALARVKAHMEKLQSLDLEKVSEEDVTLSLTSVADAATALGDLTKSSPKRKSRGADAKSKPKAKKAKK